MQISSADRILGTLKRYAPAQVRAYLGDEARDIAVPNIRRKWSRVVATLDGMAWSRLEMLDKKGGLIHTLENTDPAGELQELTGASSKAAELERMLALVLKAQDRAMGMRSDEMRVAWAAQTEVTRELMTGFRAMSSMHQEQMQAMRDLMAVRTEAAAESAIAAATGDEQNVVKQIVEAMPLIQAAMPLLKGLLGQGDVPQVAPPNGANGARKS